MTFKDLNIIPQIAKALINENYVLPTPIQEQAITPILKGRDLLGCAQTGTGKTAAFAVPILQLLSKNAEEKNLRNIRSLVLTPTRELALQIFESFGTYGKFTGLRYGVVFGGVSQKPQEVMLKNQIDILVATPGRLNDLIGQNLIDLSHIEIFVLDEADRMLDMGFLADVKKIIARTPKKKQTLLFSATMPPEISKMADTILTDPVKIAVTPISSTVEIIEQFLYYVDKKNKPDLLLDILRNDRVASALVFCRTKHGADKVVRFLTRENISAQAIHGNKSQNSRQLALDNFKKKITRVLVATDIAARGIDIDELSHVINFDLPNIPETYIHRIGRTGRAGLGGTALSFCDIDEKEFLVSIEKLTGKTIPTIDNHPFPMMITTPLPKTDTPLRQNALKPKRQDSISRPAENSRRKQNSRHNT